jgi:hypothetical protein
MSAARCSVVLVTKRLVLGARSACVRRDSVRADIRLSCRPISTFLTSAKPWTLSQAPERAEVTDDIATTAARSWAGLMFAVKESARGDGADGQAAGFWRV